MAKIKTVKRIPGTPVLVEGKHPLVVLRERVPLEQLYRELGHKNHTTVGAYSNRARKDKKLIVPADWCLTISRLTGWKLSDLRPDVYLPEHKGIKFVKPPKVAAVKVKAAPVAVKVKAAPVAVKVKAKRKPKASQQLELALEVVDSTINPVV